MARILLHICCGPCGTAAVERLQARGAVTLFFANANLYPPEEFAKRRAAVLALGQACGCPVVEDLPDHAAWRRWVAGLEDEPEGGARCPRCFEFSLRRAVGYATAHGFEALTTTLTISPHKDTATIFRVGRGLSERFLEIDFKEAGGFRRSLELSRQYGLYRQDYCGCEFSLAERRRRRPPSRPPGPPPG